MTMADYDKAMMHVELAAWRTAADLRRGGETCIEDALIAFAVHLTKLAKEARKASQHPPADRNP
jgi:hypothetical protein